MEFLYILEGLRTPLGDAFFSAITHLGEETLFIVFGLLLFWCVDKWQGYYLLATGRSGTVINQFLKLWFRIPRPWVKDPNFTIVESARAEATGYSFPSGHTQSSVGIFGALARWNKQRWLRVLCVVLCVLVPLSRMYLGVHTPADGGVSIVVALVLIFGIYPVIQRAIRQPRAMRMLLAVMVAGAVANVAYVSLYPLPADVDVSNLEHGMGNAYKMLGCMLGVWATFECDLRWTKFDTKAPLLGQARKLALGFARLRAIKSGGKAPLQALFANDYLADGLRYLLMVIFAGCIWPLTFRFFAKLGKKK